MHRGWLCLWRKVEDNASWSRGVEYRGLMITLMQKVNWKTGYFQGENIEAGQLATSYENLGNDLKLGSQKVRRMLMKMQEDGFISVSNVKNRFTLITLVNWDTYQSQEEAQRKTDERPMKDHRKTDERPSKDHRKQSNKETIQQGNKGTREQENTLMPLSEADEFKGRCPASYHPEFESFWKVYPSRNGKKNGKRKAFESWWRTVRDKIATPDELRNRIIQLAPTYGDYAKDASTWLNGRGWEDEVTNNVPEGMPNNARSRFITEQRERLGKGGLL